MGIYWRGDEGVGAWVFWVGRIDREEGMIVYSLEEGGVGGAEEEGVWRRTVTRVVDGSRCEGNLVCLGGGGAILLVLN